jgi:tRNA-dihydrouridine synthase
MIGVTDPAYRRVIAECGSADVMWSEFVSAAGLARAERRPALLPMLQRCAGERRCVAQLFGNDEAEFETAAGVVRALGCFDGVDINMGCPERHVTTSQGAGSALIRDMQLAQRIVLATKRGVNNELPVSVKTRVGFDRIVVRDWLNALLDVEPAAVTLHLRTRNEMSAVPAHWTDAVAGAAVAEWRRRADAMPLETRTRLLFNGDVDSLRTGAALAKFWNVDGVMLGRALFGTPWLFDAANRAAALDAAAAPLAGDNPPRPPLTRAFDDVVRVALRHIDEHARQMREAAAADCRTYETWLTMRKHLRAYFVPFPAFKATRLALQESNGPDEARAIIAAHMASAPARSADMPPLMRSSSFI